MYMDNMFKPRSSFSLQSSMLMENACDIHPSIPLYQELGMKPSLSISMHVLYGKYVCAKAQVLMLKYILIIKKIHALAMRM